MAPSHGTRARSGRPRRQISPMARARARRSVGENSFALGLGS
uniref:Uncharacterized protein n=1 Tax=Arundo donax TaxID=35708 RepID=A0A0A9C4V4_ARUDO